MSYNPRPNPSGDTLVSSRDQIRTNFEIIEDRFDENHFLLDGGSGGGKHKFIQMPEIPNAQAATIPATAANEGAIYTQTLGANTELYYRRENNGDELLITNQINAAANFPAAGQIVGGITPAYQYNLRANVGPNFGVEKTATGKYTIRFQNTLHSGDYIVSILMTDATGTSAGDQHLAKVVAGSQTNALFRLETVTRNGNVSDPVSIMLLVVGG